MMNVLSLLSFFCFTLYLFVGVFSLVISKRSLLNLFFSLISFSFSIWSLCFVFIYFTDDINLFWLFYKISGIGWIFGFSAIFYFLIILAERKDILKSPITNLTMFSVQCIFFLLLIFDKFIVKDAVRMNGYWKEIQNRGSFWFYAFYIYIFVIVSLGLIFVYLRYKKVKTRIDKYKLLFVFIGTLINFIAGVFLNGILAGYNYPPIAPLVSILWWIATFFAIEKFNLLKDYSKNLMDEIIEKMLDYVLVIDSERKIIKINGHALEKIGYKKDLLFNKSVFDIIERNQVIEDFLNKVDNKEINKFSCEASFLDINGKRILINLSGSIIRNKYGDSVCVVLVASDSSYFKQMEDEIKAKDETFDRLRKNIIEKEYLLKEIHHRVKNNINIITSLIGLQIEYNKDENVKNILNLTNNRIFTIAYIYEYLHKNDSIDDINVYEMMQSLTNNVCRLYDYNKISVKIQVDPKMCLNINTSIPLGLIVNELMNNSLKYAFNNETKDRYILISLIELDDGTYKLCFRDNGCGLPVKNRDIENSETLGLKLVNVLVSQLNGSVAVAVEDGTVFEIVFNKIKNK